MPEDAYPVQWTGRQAVVTLPQGIDTSNADQIREQLLWIVNRGAAVLIADLTGTDLLGQPGRIDYPTEVKRWRSLADQAGQMAERWGQRP